MNRLRNGGPSSAGCRPIGSLARPIRSLVQYCRHVVTARRIHQLIEALQTDAELDFKAWHDALKMQQRESGVLASLATKMRISQQSTYDKSRKKGESGTAKPWEV